MCQIYLRLLIGVGQIVLKVLLSLVTFWVAAFGEVICSALTLTVSESPPTIIWWTDYVREILPLILTGKLCPGDILRGITTE